MDVTKETQVWSYPRLPVLEDFKTGELATTKIPEKLPIPNEILNFVYGSESAEIGQWKQLKLLTYLQELQGWDVEYCVCGTHMVKKQQLNREIIE